MLRTSIDYKNDDLVSPRLVSEVCLLVQWQRRTIIALAIYLRVSTPCWDSTAKRDPFKSESITVAVLRAKSMSHY